VTIYQITLRDRETQTVVGYYNGAWTTDQRRALAFRRREAAEAHAARMRDRCPRNAGLINVEEIAVANQHLTRQRAARGDGPCQRWSYRTANPKGAVYAHGAGIPDCCGLDNAGIGAAARRSNGTCSE